jgi:hypothetical protein
MSDLTTIIKSETERAFNVGKNIGRVTERERIISLISKMPVLDPYQAIEVRYLLEKIGGQND